MYRKYVKPKVLSQEILKFNESVATCYYAADIAYGPVMNGGSYGTPVLSNLDQEITEVIKMTQNWCDTEAEALSWICGVYTVDLGADGFYIYEDYYPHFSPAAVAKANDLKRQGYTEGPPSEGNLLYNPGWQTGQNPDAYADDNWQDVEIALPAIPASAQGTYDTIIVSS